MVSGCDAEHYNATTTTSVVVQASIDASVCKLNDWQWQTALPIAHHQVELLLLLLLWR